MAADVTIRAAFGGAAEADLVEKLHADGDVTVKDQIIPAAALAPLAVMPDWQGHGIGTRLVQAGLLSCRGKA